MGALLCSTCAVLLLLLPAKAPVPKELRERKEDPAAVPASLLKLAALYERMRPEDAAALLKQMADAGKLELAAEILSHMPPWSAFGVINSVKDSATAGKLLERLISRPTDPQDRPMR